MVAARPENAGIHISRRTADSEAVDILVSLPIRGAILANKY
jgi:hypothetical protein